MHSKTPQLPTTWFGTGRRHRRAGRRRLSFLQSLDLALSDPPSLCCDDDQMCPACRADSNLELAHAVR